MLHHSEKEFLAKYADRLTPKLVGIVDSRLKDPSSSYVVAAQVNTEYSPTYDHTHDEVVASWAAKWVVDKNLLPIVASWVTATGFAAAVRAAVDAGVVSYGIPFDINNAYHLGMYMEGLDAMKYADDKDVVACGPMHDGTNWPANGADLYRSILSVKSCTNDGYPRGKTNTDDRTIHILAPHSSAASGAGAGAAALLRMVKPEASAGDIVDSMFAGADHFSVFQRSGRFDGDGNEIMLEHKLTWLNMLKSADILTGDTSAPPIPVEPVTPPTPITEPEPNMIEVITPQGTFTTEETWNANGRWGAEGFPQAFDEDWNTKALRFAKSAIIGYIPPAEPLKLCTGLVVYTANDAPDRDPEGVVLTFNDGSVITTSFPRTEARGIKIVAPAEFDPQKLVRIDLTSRSGSIIQFGTLKLQISEVAIPVEPPVEEPPVVVAPKRRVRKITLEYDDDYISVHVL